MIIDENGLLNKANLQRIVNRKAFEILERRKRLEELTLEKLKEQRRTLGQNVETGELLPIATPTKRDFVIGRDPAANRRSPVTPTPPEPPTITKVSIGSVDDYTRVDIFTVETPAGSSASWSTPSIPALPPGSGNGGRVQSYGTVYYAQDPQTGAVAYVAGFRAAMTYGSGAGSSQFHGHIMVLGDSIPGFQSAVEYAYFNNFPPNGQEFIGGIGLDDYTFIVDSSLIDSYPGYLGAVFSG